MLRKRWLLALGIVVVLVGALLGGAAVLRASSPASQTVTVPPAGGTDASVSWTGTIPIGSDPASDCTSIPQVANVTDDEEGLNIVVPPTGYTGLKTTFTFSITWTPSNPTGVESANDEILTVVSKEGDDADSSQTREIGSSDTSNTTETVTATNLPPGQYTAMACGFANSTLQPYTGTLTVHSDPLSASAPLASADSQGLAFSAAVPADPQRDEAEPLIDIAPDGHIYTCGPTGFSNGADYAQVSTDGGNQFHMLGTPPRGQQGGGGGGDCGTAIGITPNSAGNYQYAYAGLGALSGFTTATSADNGHSLATAGFDTTGGVTNQGALADRQWMTFIDDHTVLLAWNQQEPRNTVVLKSTDGGLNYDFSHGAIAAPNPDFPGPMHYIPSIHTVVMPWTKGEQVNLAISQDGGTTWTDCGIGPSLGGEAGFATADIDSSGNVYVAWADKTDYHTWMAALPVDKVAGCNESIAAVQADPNGEPTMDADVVGPTQVDRDNVQTTVFPWITAGGVAGRVAVTFYGTTSDGDPNVGTFKGAWNVYVNQSLNALDPNATFSQVVATTHPFHYDSICLNGLGCDIAAPAGDRTLADFFSIAYDKADGRLCVVFNRTNKMPDEALGHVAAPMVTCQVAGPSNGGGTVSVADSSVVRDSVTDPAGDAIAAYSATAPLTAPPAPAQTNEPAGDFTSASIGAAQDGGFTVTLKLADLSTAALTQALTDTGGQSLQWIWRFTNGYQDVAASAAWSPAAGFTFGYDPYTTGSAPCQSTTNGDEESEKCQVYPQAQTIAGSVDQAAGTITLDVPLSDLQQLGPNDQYGRPTQVPATAGARFYDGTAFSFVNNASTAQAAQTFLYPLDNTPAFDFLLPATSGTTSGGGGGGGTTTTTTTTTSSGTTTTTSSGGTTTSSGGGGGGGGSSASSGGTTTTALISAPPSGSSTPVSAPRSGVLGTTKSQRHTVSGRGYLRAVGRTQNAGFTVNARALTYTDNRIHLRFRSLRVSSVRFSGHSATLRGIGTLNGKRVSFSAVAVDGNPDRLTVKLGSYGHTATVVKGSITVR